MTLAYEDGLQEACGPAAATYRPSWCMSESRSCSTEEVVLAALQRVFAEHDPPTAIFASFDFVGRDDLSAFAAAGASRAGGRVVDRVWRCMAGRRL